MSRAANTSSSGPRSADLTFGSETVDPPQLSSIKDVIVRFGLRASEPGNRIRPTLGAATILSSINHPPFQHRVWGKLAFTKLVTQEERELWLDKGRPLFRFRQRSLELVLLCAFRKDIFGVFDRSQETTDKPDYRVNSLKIHY